MSVEPYALFVPFNPDPESGWLLRRRVTALGTFGSQREAIEAALDRIDEHGQHVTTPGDAVLMVQNEDGSWQAHDRHGPAAQEAGVSVLPAAP